MLAVGVYGLLWMVGMVASRTVHPHVVDDAGLRIRQAPRSSSSCPGPASPPCVPVGGPTRACARCSCTARGADRSLSVVVPNQTTVDVVLARPLVLPAGRGDTEPVTAVRLHADDHAAPVRHLREEPASREADRDGRAAR